MRISSGDGRAWVRNLNGYKASVLNPEPRIDLLICHVERDTQVFA